MTTRAAMDKSNRSVLDKRKARVVLCNPPQSLQILNPTGLAHDTTLVPSRVSTLIERILRLEIMSELGEQAGGVVPRLSSLEEFILELLEVDRYRPNRLHALEEAMGLL